MRGSLRTPAAGVALVVTLGLAGCEAGSTASSPVPAAVPAGPSSSPADAPAPPASVGSPAASNRVTFVPVRVDLPGGASAPVQPAATRDGELQVPEEVQHVGWWDGSARAGDPFGNTVVAGHVDSATEGLGFFARLLSVHEGDTVTLRGPDGHHLAYTVRSVKTIKKDALATGSAAFDQTGDPHLVLITCGGQYRRGAGGYDSNVVVTATPKGLAR
ncbi:class F sortase [Microlunatus flavus]|uniref:LPXTG-site transpeptidase (Sortase) family protein n=1 Tax=Microlunatus flavus TaxID=1036181 RepID=A0A1H9I715_9ACTN|nr:class F sortase [Microlunatus flavus]SEQ70380.1 LPXTG-site transpeptidase (sortase) family protein [Microlunatus flavus]